jgi:tetratricopeptide (TPR) repeat protein
MEYLGYILGALGIIAGFVVWLATPGNWRHRAKWVVALEVIVIVLMAIGHFLAVPLSERQIESIASEKAKEQIVPLRCELDSLKAFIRNSSLAPEDLARALSEHLSCESAWIAQAQGALDSGVVCIGSGRYQDALVHFGYALRASSLNDSVLSEVHFFRGVTYHLLDKDDDALAAWDAALQIKPADAEALYNKGVSLHYLGRYVEAIGAYDAALKLKPEFAEALNNKGNSLNDLGRYDDAIDAYDAALEMRPKFAQALYDKGNSLHLMGRNDEAIALYDAAIEINPIYTQAYYNRACANALKRKRPEMFANLKRAIELDSTCKRRAKSTTVLEPYYSDPDFQALVAE